MDDTQNAPDSNVHEGVAGEILYGSSTLPALIEIAGEQVQLGRIVTAAFAASGLTEEAWNALAEAERDSLLQAEIAKQAQPVATFEPAGSAPIETVDPLKVPGADAMNAADADETAAAPIAAEETLQDDPADPDALSSAPARPHDQLVSQLEMRWAELKEFVSRTEGELDGELGDVLDLARLHLA